MSSRALRKLQDKKGKNDIIALPPDEHEDGSNEEEEEEEIVAVQSVKSRKKKTKTDVNPFALLNDAEDGNDDTDEMKDEEEEVPVIDVNGPGTQEHEEASSLPKKKKKKKKKKKNKEAADKEHQDEDEIDAGIREVNQLLNECGEGDQAAAPDASASITFDTRALLTVEHKNLNPDNEMRRIFGSRVVHAETSQRRQRNRGRQRSSWLAQPKDTWPPMGKTGFSMSLEETRNGVQHFRIEHSHEYQQVQFKFYDAVESLNPQNIADVLRLQPYHIDALLQLSEVFRMSEDMQMATELVERALYAVEMSAHTLFSLTTGTCRLDYRRPENRAFFLGLFKHLIYVGQKGCHRTSLEFCKLLYSLDPEGDPMCVLLMVDFYALRSEQYSFLVRLYMEWESHRNLSQLPNFSFSVPLAMFHMSNQDEQAIRKADEMLQNALLMYPGVLMPLLDKCGVNPDQAVTNHSFFGSQAQNSQPDALKLLIALYIGRCHSCWKEPEVLEWLEKNVHVVLQRVDRKDPLMDDYKTKRQSRYKGTPRNIFRHIVVSEIKDATATLPPDLANTAVLSYDPLPPPDSISSYERPERATRVQLDGNALTMFFRSLLPNFNVDEPAAEEAGAAGGNLRQGVGALMDAMRDLLNNIRPVDPPVENNPNAQEEDDDEGVGEWD